MKGFWRPFGLCLALCLGAVEWFAFHPVFMGEEHLLTESRREVVLEMTWKTAPFRSLGITVLKAEPNCLVWDIHCFPGDTTRVEWIEGDGWSHQRVYH